MDALYVLAFFIVFLIALYIVIGCVRYFGAGQQQARLALRAQPKDSADAM